MITTFLNEGLLGISHILVLEDSTEPLMRPLYHCMVTTSRRDKGSQSMLTLPVWVDLKLLSITKLIQLPLLKPLLPDRRILSGETPGGPQLFDLHGLF